MKTLIIGFLGAMVLTTTANAEIFEMDHTLLREGKVASNKKCVTVASGFIVKASTPNGRLTTYKTDNRSHGHGIYIGAPSGLPYTTANTTAPGKGTYQLTFEPAVTSIELRIDWISDVHKPVETLSAFATEHGTAQVDFKPVGNSSEFDGKNIVAKTNRGAGVLTYSGKPFKKFKFDHLQNPRNIGFTIKNIKAETAPIECP